VKRCWPNHPHYLCLAESRDGITWTKPSLGLYEFQGSKDNNIISAAEDGPGVPFLDTNPTVQPSERYKAAWAKKGADGVWGMYISVSPDGLHWKKWREGPGFTSTLPNAFDSVNLIFWSESENQYVCYFRFMTQSVRSIVRTTSKDLIHWTEQVPLDFGDTPVEHFYTNGTTPYFRAPDLYFAFRSASPPGERRSRHAESRHLRRRLHGQPRRHPLDPLYRVVHTAGSRPEELGAPHYSCVQRAGTDGRG